MLAARRRASTAIVVVTAPGKAAWPTGCNIAWSHRSPRPLKRVYIAKANGKQRPLGIPVIVDRACQAQVVNALEPEWEARFEPKSYGFRPGRGCHDAIAGSSTRPPRAKLPGGCWVLDADLAAAFDRIDHAHFSPRSGRFPGQGTHRGG